MKKYKYLDNVCKKILSREFNYSRYMRGKTYQGRYVQTRNMFCGRKIIGMVINIDDDTIIRYYWGDGNITINDKPYKQAINIEYLECNDIHVVGEKLWDDEPNSVELEDYTDAGADMIIHLTELSKAEFEKYINEFDINDEVMNWWRDGIDAAHKHGVPFDNIKDHYTDYENWLKKLRKICKKMPY